MIISLFIKYWINFKLFFQFYQEISLKRRVLYQSDKIEGGSVLSMVAKVCSFLLMKLQSFVVTKIFRKKDFIADQNF